MPSVEFYFGLLIQLHGLVMIRTLHLVVRIWFEVIGIDMLEYVRTYLLLSRGCTVSVRTMSMRELDRISALRQRGLTDGLSAKSHKCKFKGL